jgi:hypothetical protein
MKTPTSVEVDSIHESGHVVIGALIGVTCRSVTTDPPAHCTLTLRGTLTLMFDEDKRAIFFLAGMVTQHSYYPDVPLTSQHDQAILYGLPERRRIMYEDFIRKHLGDPVVRGKIEELANIMKTKISIQL